MLILVNGQLCYRNPRSFFLDNTLIYSYVYLFFRTYTLRGNCDISQEKNKFRYHSCTKLRFFACYTMNTTKLILILILIKNVFAISIFILCESHSHLQPSKTFPTKCENHILTSHRVSHRQARNIIRPKYYFLQNSKPYAKYYPFEFPSHSQYNQQHRGKRKSLKLPRRFCLIKIFPIELY